MLENEIYNWLNSYSIPTPQYKIFNIDEEPDVDFYPVALKILSDKVVHKTDAGAVIINIENKEALSKAKHIIEYNLTQKIFILIDRINL